MRRVLNGTDGRTRRFKDTGSARALQARPPELPAETAWPTMMMVVHEILLVEDNHDARETLRLLLKLGGHRVTPAETGERAIELGKSFALALIDIGLPDVDGYQVAQRIRASGAAGQTRLVALTGYGQPEDIRRALESGFDAHVLKPVNPDSLTKALSDLFSK